MSKSIFLETLNGKKTERPPVWFMRQAGRVLPNYLKLREKHSFSELMHDPVLASEVTLMPVADLGVDAAILFSDILVIPVALGMKLNFTDSGPRFDKALRELADPVGYLQRDATQLDYIYRAIDEIVARKQEEIPLIGFCGGPFTTLCYMIQGLSSNHTFPDAVNLLYRDRKVFHQLMSTITELSVEYARNQVRHGVQAFQIFETHAGLLPADLYVREMVPYVSQIAAAVREEGVKAIFLPKGLGYGLKDLRPEVADFVSVDWQMPIQEARKLIDPAMGIQGNLDPRLLFGGKQEILGTLEKYLDFGSRNADWIFNLGHGFVPGIPYENARLVVEWIQEANWRRS
ncbi:MAG: uroporphyrinogen decarboxylase [Marinilabiliales bacterium]|nr:uroporphyrinogen decarboxylase [Marinilabiliales bacterium]